MNVGELIEGHYIYRLRIGILMPFLKIKQQRGDFRAVLPDLNQVLVGVGKRNPAYSSESISTNDVLLDDKLSVSYIKLDKNT